MLKSRKLHERVFIREVTEELSPRTVLVPWEVEGTELTSVSEAMHGKAFEEAMR